MYRCSECRRPIGAMYEMDKNGNPVPAQFKCPHTGHVARMTTDSGTELAS